MKEVQQLRRIRLEEDLSYRALGRQIGLPERTVFRILNADDEPKLWDRTLFKIQRYLKDKASAKRSVGDRRRSAVSGEEVMP